MQSSPAERRGRMGEDRDSGYFVVTAWSFSAARQERRKKSPPPQVHPCLTNR
jgi:hypothetical protein